LPEYSRLPGYDAVVQGLAGLQDVTGMPDGPPSRVGVPMSDLLSGMAAFQAVLLALLRREKTGEGAFLDISMLDATAAVLTFHAAGALNASTQPSRQGNRHSSIAPYETFSGSDGYFNLAVGNDEQFVALCGLLSRVEWVADARFATNPDRVRNRDVLSSELGKIFASKTADEWVASLSAKGIPVGRIHSVAQAVEHPQLKARGKVVTAEHPVAGALKFLGTPSTAEGTVRAPPTLGQHTREVLAGVLKLPRAEIDALFRDGVAA
jgi:formyl-CoA transferase